MKIENTKENKIIENKSEIHNKNAQNNYNHNEFFFFQNKTSQRP